MAVEPETMIGAGLVAHAAKDVLSKLLGPTASLYGDNLRSAAEKCNENFAKIVVKAWKKAGEPSGESGGVHPRVLKHVWDEGRFVEDELSAEYFGGLLASSRNEDGTDDRAVPFVNTVSQMSAEQIRLHYVSYLSGLLLTQRNKAEGYRPCHFKWAIFVLRGSEVAESMSHGGRRLGDIGHAVSGLERLGLVGPNSDFRSGDLSESFVWIEPTYFGTELFLRAHGLSEKTPVDYMAGNVSLDGDPVVPACPMVHLNHVETPPTHDDITEAIREFEKRQPKLRPAKLR